MTMFELLEHLLEMCDCKLNMYIAHDGKFVMAVV